MHKKIFIILGLALLGVPTFGQTEEGVLASRTFINTEEGGVAPLGTCTINGWYRPVTGLSIWYSCPNKEEVCERLVRPQFSHPDYPRDCPPVLSFVREQEWMEWTRVGTTTPICNWEIPPKGFLPIGSSLVGNTTTVMKPGIPGTWDMRFDIPVSCLEGGVANLSYVFPSVEIPAFALRIGCGKGSCDCLPEKNGGVYFSVEVSTSMVALPNNSIVWFNPDGELSIYTSEFWGGPAHGHFDLKLSTVDYKKIAGTTTRSTATFPKVEAKQEWWVWYPPLCEPPTIFSDGFESGSTRNWISIN